MNLDVDLDNKVNVIVLQYSMVKKKMFGGSCYLEDKKTVCGVWKNYLILRIGQALCESALKDDYVLKFDITGKTMKGWIMIEHKHLSVQDIADWISKARSYVKTIEK